MSLQGQLKAHGIRAKKSLGQHWLMDAGAVQAIVVAAEIAEKDEVVEVGPGPGVLTPLLCERAKHVTALELDPKMVEVLQANTATLSNLTIQQADVLGVDPAEHGERYQVVGNLPYYITSSILKHFLEAAHKPFRLTVTIQKEVAERIVAEPPKMSLLALSVQLYGEPRLVKTIKATSFTPPPKVDSAILVVDNIGRQENWLQGLPEETFWGVARAGFAEKRKQLHNTLARHLDLSHETATDLLQEAGVDPARRAETLTIPEWVTIGKAYAKR